MHQLGGVQTMLLQCVSEAVIATLGEQDSERDSTQNASVIAGVPDSDLIECFFFKSF